MEINFIKSITILTLFVSFFSCQNHDITSLAGTRSRVKKVTLQSQYEVSINEYTYNSTGRLDTIYLTYTNRGKTNYIDYYYKAVMHYDLQGRLAVLECQPAYTTTLPSPQTTYPRRYVYEYDKKGHPVRIKLSSTSPDSSYNKFIKTTFYLDYGSNNFPIKISDVNDLYKSGFIYEYTYDKGNIIEIKKSESSLEGVKPIYTRTYQFDDKPNPFYGLYIGEPDPDIIFKFSAFHQTNNFNKNNSINPYLKYEYDLKGNLIKILGNIVTTIEYETY